MKAMNTLPKFPPAIYRYVKSAFRGANKRVCELLARVPNCPEQALDMTLINFLSAYAAPAVVAPGWFVRIDVYFIGGLRHFNNWEIGDIGVLIFAKRAGTVIANKLAVLQSKRLYPDQGTVIEQTAEDFRIGMGTLLPGGLEAPLSQSHLFPLAGVQIQGTDRRGQSIQGDSGLRGEASHPGPLPALQPLGYSGHVYFSCLGHRAAGPCGQWRRPCRAGRTSPLSARGAERRLSPLVQGFGSRGVRQSCARFRLAPRVLHGGFGVEVRARPAVRVCKGGRDLQPLQSAQRPHRRRRCRHHRTGRITPQARVVTPTRHPPHDFCNLPAPRMQNSRGRQGAELVGSPSRPFIIALHPYGGARYLALVTAATGIDGFKPIFAFGSTCAFHFDPICCIAA